MTSDDENPTVTLGGEKYVVLPVAFREVSKMLPLVNSVMPALRKGDTSEETLLDLGKLIYYGIKRNTKLTLEEFLDLPATIEDMVGAAMTVCSQAGLKQKAPSEGEAQGAGSPLT